MARTELPMYLRSFAPTVALPTNVIPLNIGNNQPTRYGGNLRPAKNTYRESTLVTLSAIPHTDPQNARTNPTHVSNPIRLTHRRESPNNPTRKSAGTTKDKTLTVAFKYAEIMWGLSM